MQSALIADAKPRLEGAPQRNTTTTVCARHQRFCFLRKLSTEAKAKKAYLQFAFPYVYITKTKTFPNLFPESFRGFNNFFQKRSKTKTKTPEPTRRLTRRW